MSMKLNCRRVLLPYLMITSVLTVVVGGCAQSSLGPSMPQTVPQTASIGGTTNAASPADKKAAAVKIALILPLGGYGEPAQIARGMKQAAEMALFEADNPAVQLITKDDGGSLQGAMAAADSAISEGAEIILGPLFGKSASAIAPIASKAGIPVVSFSNDPAVAGKGVYLMSFLASEEVKRVVGYAASQGKRRFAALIPDSIYGKTIEPVFRAAVTKTGGEVVALETYSADASGMLASAKTVIRTIKDSGEAGHPVDALFVPASPETLGQLGPLLAYSGLTAANLKLLGTSAWDAPVISREDALIGGWYAASDPAGWTSFAGKYRKTFGTAPPRLATLSYDAMSMALALAATPGPSRFSPDNLTRAQGFSGVDGAVRLTMDGFSQRGLAVLEIEKYSSVVIDAAPQAAPLTAAPQAMAASPEARLRLE
jgi:branched-chain amino acid transport system substrate-binding protein